MPLSKKFGVVLAIVHLLVFIIFVTLISLSSEGQMRLLWAIWLPIDFPVSLLVIWGFDFIPIESSVGSFIRTWLPYFVHGILGTMWWYFIPIIIGKLFSKVGNKRYIN